MYNAFLERTKETISALKSYIYASEQFRTALFDGVRESGTTTLHIDPRIFSIEKAPDRLEWRVIDHCTAVTRIYAIYEQFVHEMIREHLSLLQSRVLFADLPSDIRTSYRMGVAKILDKKDGPRFSDIDLGSLIGGYDRALRGQAYILEPRAMLMQEQNLRIPELHRFMKACGIDGVEIWIERHRSVKAFFEREDRLTASAASEMAELIKYRNDASHGSIDISSILHMNVLLELCDFVSACCEALAERIQLAGLQALKVHRQVAELGKITECLKSGKVAIGTMSGLFKVGATIYLCGEAYCVERTLVSLQIEGVSVEEVDLVAATELGMGLDAPAKKNAVVMSVNAVQSPISSTIEAVVV